MRRRVLLRGSATALVALAGCSGGSGGPSDPLKVVSFEDKRDDAENLLVTVTVANRTGQETKGTLYVYVTVSGKDYTEARSVTLAGSETKSYDVGFDVSYDAFSADGGLSFGFDYPD